MTVGGTTSTCKTTCPTPWAHSRGSTRRLPRLMRHRSENPGPVRQTHIEVKQSSKLREGRLCEWGRGRYVNMGSLCEHGKDVMWTRRQLCECGVNCVNMETIMWMGDGHVNGGATKGGELHERETVLWIGGQAVMRIRGSYEKGTAVWTWDSNVNRGSDTNEGTRIRRTVMSTEGQNGCSQNTNLLREQMCEKLHQG